MVTAFLELHRGRTIKASLPSLLLRDFSKSLRRFVFRAFATSVPFAIAGGADFRATAIALAVSAARGSVGVNVCRLDPFAAALGGAVDTVFGGIFLVFLVPFLFEA